MTKSTIILPSVKYREYEGQLAENDASIAEPKRQLAEYEAKKRS